MHETVQFLLRHGNLVLFGVVFVEQIGFPLPAVPFLLAAGTMAGGARLQLASAIGMPVLAALLGDLLWYYLGRRRGMRVLNWLCRISLEPDSCVRRTENAFTRHGVRSLLIAKFVPGLNTVSPPLAGVFGVRTLRFLLYDGAGAILWAGSFVALGYLFRHQLEGMATYAVRLGSALLVLVVVGAAAYIALKYAQRRHLLRRLRVARISPEELRQMMDAGDVVSIVDLRHSLDVETAPYAIPGALRLSPEELGNRHHEIPRDRDVILYCS